MLGRYVLQTSEGFSDFMYRIDIGWFQRAIACSLYPVQVFSQDPLTGEITVDTLTTFRSFSSSFSLNTPYTDGGLSGGEVAMWWPGWRGTSSSELRPEVICRPS